MNEMSQSQLPRLTASVTRKINTGNYESVDFFASFSMDLATSEHPVQRLAWMTSLLEAFLHVKERETLDAVNKSNIPTLFELIQKVRENKIAQQAPKSNIDFKKLPGSDHK